MTVSNVGIVGAGQLGRMLALAGYPLGLQCLFLDSSADAPAAQVAPIIVSPLDDPEKLLELAARSDVVTFDWENIAGTSLLPLERMTALRPPRAALEASQDRLKEKALFNSLRIPVAAHAAVDSKADLDRAVAALGSRGILKTRRMGYDGKGQHTISRSDDLDDAWQRVRGTELIYEQFQDFSREISVIGARSISGEIAYYPLTDNTHAAGVLRYSVAPFVNPKWQRTARSYLARVMEALEYVGILTIEFFVVGGQLVANEMAPRVHNSGHWTIDGCVTSQFENHLRAICDLPLGSTRPLGHSAMVNFLGNMPDRARLLEIEGLAYHDYGKTPRPGRKLGHCTVVKAGSRQRNAALSKVLQSVEWT